MHKHKVVIVIIPLTVIITIIALFLIQQQYQTFIAEIPKFAYNQLPQIPITDNKSTSSTTQNLIPNTLLLSVPFTPQAPTGNWDELHNEACEEASAIMAERYFAGGKTANLTPEIVERQIDNLTKWQDANFGYHLDTTAAETARMIGEVYNLKTKLINNFTANDLKRELAQNRLILVSENGRMLKNPYYKQPGPIHHMLVIRGFDKEGNFITNDSGTKRGLNYPYAFKTIYDSAADWSHANNTTDTNTKIAIVVWK